MMTLREAFGAKKEELKMEKVKITTNGILKAKFPDTDKWNNTPITVLDFDTRTQNVLDKLGVDTLGKLVCSLKAIPKARNCGEATKKNIYQKLIQYHLDSMTDEEQIMYLLDLYVINGGDAKILDEISQQAA